MLSHSDIWNAIDRLAETNGLSPSGLAKKAGLSSTLFNPSKRSTQKRKRWPSTESIAAILRATSTSLDDFMAMANPHMPQHSKLPFLNIVQALKDGALDPHDGLIVREKWDEMHLPASTDVGAFALEIAGSSSEPLYRDGEIVILSPSEKPRRNDRVAVYTRQGEILLRLLGREGAQKIELLSLTPDAPPLTLERQNIYWMYRIVWASQ